MNRIRSTHSGSLQRLQVVVANRTQAGNDCGFGTYAGFGAVDANVVCAKLAAKAEGTAMLAGNGENSA